jgi:hypothetical protein
MGDLQRRLQLQKVRGGVARKEGAEAEAQRGAASRPLPSNLSLLPSPRRLRNYLLSRCVIFLDPSLPPPSPPPGAPGLSGKRASGPGVWVTFVSLFGTSYCWNSSDCLRRDHCAINSISAAICDVDV